MRIEIGSQSARNGALHLSPNQTLKITDGAGSTVHAVQGSVWITEENDRNDVVLEPGKSYRLRARGLALINALGGEAAVSFA